MSLTAMATQLTVFQPFKATWNVCLEQLQVQRTKQVPTLRNSLDFMGQILQIWFSSIFNFYL